jgi:glutathione-regulated potassium-efflux system ancillary protein KefC
MGRTRGVRVSLRSARSTLEALGWPAHEARESAMRFRRRNIKLSDEIYPHYKDRAKLIAANKAGRQQFEEQMAREREERQRRSGRDWDRLDEKEGADS